MEGNLPSTSQSTKEIIKVNPTIAPHREEEKEIKPKHESIIILGDLKIDMEKFMVYRGNEDIVLPRKEFALLLLLVSKPQKVFSRDEIFSNVWGNDIIVGDRTIDVHIRKLREKIGEDLIQTVKGVGYKFMA